MSHSSSTKVVHLKVDGVLDLHHFKPREVPELVRDYLAECKRLRIAEVRIIHGKGKGVLRAIVQEILAADPQVESFGPALDGSGWGVTIARLRVKGQPADRGKKPGQPQHTLAPSLWQRLAALIKIRPAKK